MACRTVGGEECGCGGGRQERFEGGGGGAQEQGGGGSERREREEMGVGRKRQGEMWEGGKRKNREKGRETKGEREFTALSHLTSFL